MADSGALCLDLVEDGAPIPQGSFRDFGLHVGSYSKMAVSGVHWDCFFLFFFVFFVLSG